MLNRFGGNKQTRTTKYLRCFVATVFPRVIVCIIFKWQPRRLRRHRFGQTISHLPCVTSGLHIFFAGLAILLAINEKGSRRFSGTEGSRLSKLGLDPRSPWHAELNKFRLQFKTVRILNTLGHTTHQLTVLCFIISLCGMS